MVYLKKKKKRMVCLLKLKEETNQHPEDSKSCQGNENKIWITDNLN